jgi:hypothetical protein
MSRDFTKARNLGHSAALAKERKAELVTGDQEFKPLEREIKIHWLR